MPRHARGRWDGCGAPAILTIAILAILLYVFRDAVGDLVQNLFANLTGRH